MQFFAFYPAVLDKDKVDITTNYYYYYAPSDNHAAEDMDMKIIKLRPISLKQ